MLGGESTERFEILESLGQGGMGTVYRAVDRQRGQRVALKRLTTPDPASIHRFKNEFRALAGVVHPNLVALYDLVASDNDWCFTMELVEGVDFLTYVCGPELAAPALSLVPTEVSASESSGSNQTMATVELEESEKESLTDAGRRLFGPANQLRLGPALAQLAEAIAALHGTGHLHRDIKPSNILVDSDGRVVVLDFGIITELIGAASAGPEALAGTPFFMAPELFESEPPGATSDWYAFGIIIYMALTGYRPFGGQRSKMLRLKRQPSLFLGRLEECAGLVELTRLCADLLQADPAKRPEGPEILRRLGAKEQSPEAMLEQASVMMGRRKELSLLHDAWQNLSLIHI